MPATTHLTGTPSVVRAVHTLARGGMVVVVDDADREDEGDLVTAAATADPELVAFVVRHTTGILCAPMPADRTRTLQLPQMVAPNSDPHATAFTVTVDHVDCGTGVSAADRSRTLRSLADPNTQPAELRRPGHVFPLEARTGGVLTRAGHTEAAVDLLHLAELPPVGLIGEIVAPDGSMARGDGLRAFADEHDLPLLAVADLVRHRLLREHFVERVAAATIPTAVGSFRALTYRSNVDGTEHLALALGDVAEAGRAAGLLVRVHSECLTGDVVGSLRCDCGAQLEHSMQAIAEAGAGLVIYLRGHEGRGVGLTHKIRAYALQEGGLDTVEANLAQGLPADSRDYAAAGHILHDLGVSRVRLLTNNPDKVRSLAEHGVEVVERLPLTTPPNRHNKGYLATKVGRMGHHLDLAG